MLNNKKLFFLFCSFLLIFVSNFVFTKNVYAAPLPTYYLNGNQQDVTFNPNNEETVDIEVRMSEEVKFTRIYICTMDQECNGTKGNYIRYFSPNSTSSSVVVSWNGKGSGNDGLVSEGEYKIAVTFYESGSDSSITTVGLYKIFVDFSNTNNDNNSSAPTSSNSCTSFTYSSWGSCSNGIQSRTVLTSSPNSCTGGNPELTKNCSTSSTSTNTTTKVVTKIVYVSTHSDEEDLSNYSEKDELEISAGRERMALVGSPIKFEAKYNLTKNQCTPIFNWSYGDGFSGSGKEVSHTYKFPGEYQVVLNSVCGDYSAVSRTVVKVILPNIKITRLDTGDLEILNKGENEINIGNYKIIGTPNIFNFAEDTIITSKNKIIISKNDLGFVSSTSNVIHLLNPSGGEVAYFLENTDTDKKVENTLNVVILESKNEGITQKDVVKQKLSVKKETKIDGVLSTSTLEKDIEYSSTTQTATVLESNIVDEEGIFLKIIQTPIKSIKSFLNKFYDF